MSALTQVMKRQLAIGALAYWIPVLLFIALVNEVTEHEPLFFDVPILQFMNSLSTPWLDTVVLYLTKLGGIVFVSIATAAAAYFGYRQFGRRAAAMVLLIAGGAGVMNVILKLIFQRDRPQLWAAIVNESSYSFPSGHAMASSALALSIVALFWLSTWRTRVIALAVIYVAVVGATRLYLGVHYPSDILAGWTISFI